ncbi:MAG: 7-cyano-7-deazaguanine synthase QueC [Candidatus Ratteibacteria bacterium]|nr:7-cyano-7-deazaguanine synthase QueC [Candidatus Ratteibacteria bacterium]
MKKAVILTSGGLDSTTVLAIAKSRGFKIYALTFDYGQRHKRELSNAKKVAKYFKVAEHKILKIDLRCFGGSALTDNIKVPRKKNLKSKKIPSTYVPARNTIFLSYALAWAEVLKSHDIFIGVNAVDYSGYPDCRKEYLKAYQKMADLATKEGIEGKPIKIHSPLINHSKAEIIKKGMKLGVDYSITHSCYNPTANGLACGKCDSCRLRKKGFGEIGLKDPIKYVV